MESSLRAHLPKNRKAEPNRNACVDHNSKSLDALGNRPSVEWNNEHVLHKQGKKNNERLLLPRITIPTLLLSLYFGC